MMRSADIKYLGQVFIYGLVTCGGHCAQRKQTPQLLYQAEMSVWCPSVIIGKHITDDTADTGWGDFCMRIENGYATTRDSQSICKTCL